MVVADLARPIRPPRPQGQDIVDYLVQYEILADGHELTFAGRLIEDPDAAATLTAWLTAKPERSKAQWSNDRGRPLRWMADGQVVHSDGSGPEDLQRSRDRAPPKAAWSALVDRPDDRTQPRGAERMTLRIVSWNIGQRVEPWSWLEDDKELDVALLQEATAPPVGLRQEVASGAEWRLAGWEQRAFSAAVVRCSDRFDVEPNPPLGQLGDKGTDEYTLAVSRPGTLAVATVSGGDLTAPIIVVSAYAPWERPVPLQEQGWIYADASAHRLISDISGLIDSQASHRLIVAGDWNILHGYGEHNSPYWGARYQTVFDRMTALGLEYVGPRSPHGEVADPVPEELPKYLEGVDVPTFRRHLSDPSTATRQLDFVFASRSIASSVTAKALNSEADWGPSDHCRVLIDVDPG